MDKKDLKKLEKELAEMGELKAYDTTVGMIRMKLSEILEKVIPEGKQTRESADEILTIFDILKEAGRKIQELETKYTHGHMLRLDSTVILTDLMFCFVRSPHRVQALREQTHTFIELMENPEALKGLMGALAGSGMKSIGVEDILKSEGIDISDTSGLTKKKRILH